MNLIKLKDIIKPNDDFFNQYLKGKYAYWVHMRYIVPFDLMKHEGYVACEVDINKLLKQEDGTYPIPYGVPYKDIYEEGMERYVDKYETDNVNNIIKYRLKNQFTADSNITIDELKKFRTWLATQLLLFDTNNLGEQLNSIYSEEETHVLTYYKKGMYDDVIKYLSVFGSMENVLQNINSSSCGCNADLSSLYNLSLTTCDPLSIYKKNIYERMVQMFSTVRFWGQFPKEFILEFKKYIDNIIKCNFKLTKSPYVSDYADCGCNDNDDQENMIAILNRLSNALKYIADGNLLGRKNYIYDAFHDWSVYLYELMEW